MHLWSPEVWDKVGVVTLALIVGAFHVMAYIRGWFVPGRYHREIVGTYEQRIEEQSTRASVDSETIKIQAQTIAENNAKSVVADHLLESIRDLVERGRT